MTAAAKAKPSAAFFCVADDRYFLGAVGLVNSLRLHGHDEPVHVLDCGLTPAQRELLATEARIVDPPGDDELHPWLLKTVAPLAHPAEVAVLIDTDMIVTRSLAPLIERAAEGAVVAFENDTPRFVPEWGELLDLGEARPGPYVSSGLVLAGGEAGARLLDAAGRPPGGRRYRPHDLRHGRGGLRLPLPGAGRPQRDPRARGSSPSDQDALENRLAPNPPFAGVRLADEGAVRVRYDDGTEPYVLHHFHRKPWLDPIYHGLYSRLLARLLLGPGIALRVDPEEVPLRMRSGARARVERARVDATDVFRRKVLRRHA